MSTQSEQRVDLPHRAIPLSVPSLDGNEWEYVKECLDTNWVSSVGRYVDRFEQMLAECTDANYAVATVNGTAALHMALLVAGVRPDDEVLVSTLTFIASANAIRYAGAWPVFIDAEPCFGQIDPNLIDDFCRNECSWKNGTLTNTSTGRRVTAIMPVHILGHPVDMDPILELAQRYELPVIEDAAESLGARYKGRKVGPLGTIGCFSFNGNKTITTGGGGMIVTNDQQLADRARYLTTQAKDDPIEYVHREVGYNYRLPNVLAAIGCAQVETLDQAVSAKRKIAARYGTALTKVPGIDILPTSDDVFSTKWLTTIRVNRDQYGCDNRALQQHLQKRRIESRALWQPMHLSHAHRGAPQIMRGVAEKLADECLCLPSSVDLSPADQNRVIEEIDEIARKKTAVIRTSRRTAVVENN